MQMTIATLHCHLELAAINCFIAGMAGNISCVLHNYKNIKLKRLPELMGKTYDRGLKFSVFEAARGYKGQKSHACTQAIFQQQK